MDRADFRELGFPGAAEAPRWRNRASVRALILDLVDLLFVANRKSPSWSCEGRGERRYARNRGIRVCAESRLMGGSGLRLGR